MHSLKALTMILALCLPASSWAAPPRIIDRPIRFGPKRKALTLEYIRTHYGLHPKTVEITPKAVVVHWTGTPSLEATFRAFDREVIRTGRARLRKHGRLNLSAHFLVARDGRIYRLLPETWMARHCIGLNYDSIGIENVGGGRKHPLTQAQLRANVGLIAGLARRHPIRWLLGHFEAQQMKGTALYRERNKNYRSNKTDPGKRFMRELRKKLKALRLEQPPGRRPGRREVR